MPSMTVRSVTAGYVDTGHLYGHRAFVVDTGPLREPLDEDGRPTERLSISEVAEMAADSGLSRVHVELHAANLPDGWALYGYLERELPQRTITLSVPPGAVLPGEGDAVLESVLAVRAGDIVDASRPLESRAGSVCFHYWPGAPTLADVELRCVAPYGYYLVLSGDDIGQAKNWLAHSGSPVWQLVPAYPFDQFEPAEFLASADPLRLGGPQ